jgi:hypothetical protein
MPRFDGTGPRGSGPMTGRGEGYCILELPKPDRPAQGYAGLTGTPVYGRPLAARWPLTTWWRRPAITWGWGRATRRGRGRRLSRW